MQQIISVNLGGRLCPLEQAACERVQRWLENSRQRLAGDPDREEIVADLELALADRCAALLQGGRQFIATADVERLLAELGPVQSAGGAAIGEGAAGAGAASGAEGMAPPGRRLVQVREGAVLTGLCNGLGAHFRIDVTWVRIGFVVLAFMTGGAAILLYLLLALIIPYADTPPGPTAIDVLQANLRSLFEQLRRLVTGKGSHPG